MGWAKAKRQQRRVYKYHSQIKSLYGDSKLDENDIGSLHTIKRDITDEYVQGKITDQQNENLKDEISLIYKEIYDKKINSLNDGLGKDSDKFLDSITNDLTNAYAIGIISEIHYNILNKKISKIVNDNNISKKR